MTDPLNLKTVEAWLAQGGDSHAPTNAETRLVLQKLLTLVREMTAALRNAPMPYAESISMGDDWDDKYDDWWHANASEAAILAKVKDE